MPLQAVALEADAVTPQLQTNGPVPPIVAPTRADPLPKWESTLPYIVLGSLLAFVFFSCLDSLANRVVTVVPNYPRWLIGVLSFAPIFGLIVLTTSFGWWFIFAFTGPPVSLAKQRECFRFAYALTITSFVVLVFPYLNVWKPDIAGPISLVRGCVEDVAPDPNNGQVVPRSIACVVEQLAKGKPASVTAGAPGNNEAPNTPSNEPAQQDANGTATGCVAVANSPTCPNSIAPRAISVDAYPWVLAIGGFVGKTFCQSFDEDQKAYVPTACLDDDPKQIRYSHFTNGLVVPFYVVFLAFIGGAVSLSRRIPEHQKCSEEGYRTTWEPPALAPMQPYEVREAVVFQIMQLISAPFIALTAFWVVAPNSLAAGIGLAFVSGFASETILLLIRGFVDGVRPQNAPVPAKQLTATVADTPGALRSSEPRKSITMRVAVRANPPADAGTVALVADGSTVALSAEGFAEVTLEVGREHILAASGKRGSESLSASLKLVPSLDDEAKPLTLTLASAA